MERPMEACSHSDDEWMMVLKNYSYPTRPCDGGCFDDCAGRPSCPLYRAWEYMISKEPKKCVVET